jgi:CDP-diacylglycerol--glycerol-3-phosphate 3-phosphatidyltransferase
MSKTASQYVREDVWNLPNALTFGRILVIPPVCWFLYLGVQDDTIASRWNCVIAAFLFGFASATDYFDGYIARRRNLVSLTGKFLDPMADKLLVMAVLCTLLTSESIPLWFVVLALGRELAITGLRALAAAEGMIISSDWGGKWKTAFQLVGLICLIIFHPYHVRFGLFDLVVDFARVGFMVMLLSLFYSLTSAWTYFQGFLQGIAALRTGDAAS